MKVLQEGSNNIYIFQNKKRENTVTFHLVGFIKNNLELLMFDFYELFDIF